DVEGREHWHLGKGRGTAEAAAGELRARDRQAVRRLDGGLRVALVVLEHDLEGDGLIADLEAAGVVYDLGGKLGSYLSLRALLGRAAREGQAEADGHGGLGQSHAGQRQHEQRQRAAPQEAPREHAERSRNGCHYDFLLRRVRTPHLAGPEHPSLSLVVTLAPCLTDRQQDNIMSV